MYGRSASHLPQGAVGLLGTVALMVSALTCRWYEDEGLWGSEGAVHTKGDNQTTVLPNGRAQGAQMFFAGLSFIMAAADSCICLVYVFCLSPPRYPKHAHWMPGSLLLAVLPPTGFFFSVAWTIFTWQHREAIIGNWAGLGSSYWLGGAAWTTLLFLLPVLYLVDKCAVTDGGHKGLPV